MPLKFSSYNTFASLDQTAPLKWVQDGKNEFELRRGCLDDVAVEPTAPVLTTDEELWPWHHWYPSPRLSLLNFLHVHKMFSSRSYVMYEKELAYYVTQPEVEMCHACHVFPYSLWYDIKRAQLKPHSGMSSELFWG